MSARSRQRRRQARALGIPSAGQTIVSLVLHPLPEGGPWPLTRVLTALGAFGVERVGVARALGDRRGVPLVHSQELRWREVAVFLEARHGRDGLDELALELPPWDEIALVMDEDRAWELIDAVAASADAQFGSVGDGEPPETQLPDDAPALRAQLRRHLALLLPAWSAPDVAEWGGRAARTLPLSGLAVVAQ